MPIKPRTPSTTGTRNTRVKRDFAVMRDGTRYKTNGNPSGGWVRVSLKHHEQKDGNGRPRFTKVNSFGLAIGMKLNRSAERRIRKQLSK